ncbi:MAG: CCA tRNA nucleotidyltransferase [Oligoflexia bacterium]|nr:CCA tRNA nucleotidyltransferase [Oligoflexia bacterium]
MLLALATFLLVSFSNLFAQEKAPDPDTKGFILNYENHLNVLQQIMNQAKVSEDPKETPRAFFVGGSVRDYLLGKRGQDADIEIYHVPFDELEKMVAKVFPNPSQYKVYRQYGMIHIEDPDLDLAVPRREKYSKESDKLEIEIAPHLSYSDALIRRDLTVNAVLMDALKMYQLYKEKRDLPNIQAMCEQGILIDPYHAIGEKELKVVDEQYFVREPHRLLRAMRFISSLHLQPGAQLTALAKSMHMKSSLPARLIFGETNKLFSLQNPLEGLRWVKSIDQLSMLFPPPCKLPDIRTAELLMEKIPDGAEWSSKQSRLLYAALLLQNMSIDFKDFGKCLTKIIDDGDLKYYLSNFFRLMQKLRPLCLSSQKAGPASDIEVALELASQSITINNQNASMLKNHNTYRPMNIGEVLTVLQAMAESAVDSVNSLAAYKHCREMVQRLNISDRPFTALAKKRELKNPLLKQTGEEEKKAGECLKKSLEMQVMQSVQRPEEELSTLKKNMEAQ